MVARAIFVASSGGHLQELMQLRSTLVSRQSGITDVTWVTFDCAQSRSLLADEPDVIYVPEVRTRGYRALIRSFLPALRILRQVRPSRVYSTGAAIALAFLPFAFLVRARATYIESATRIQGPSVTGRLLSFLPWVRLHTQYKSWARGRWHYGASVFEELTAREINTPGRTIRRVVVTLGTQPKYPFVSLVQRLREVVPAEVEVLWQIGPDFPAAARPDGAHDFVPNSTLHEWMGSADVVIAHAGVGSALSALRAGHKPVLVARRQSAGEHVDDHQHQLVDELAHRDLAVVATPNDLTWEHIVDASRSVVENSIDIDAKAKLDQLSAAKTENRASRSVPTRTRISTVSARKALVWVVAIVALIGSGAFTNGADAVGRATAQSVVPNAVPSKATPNITNGVDYAIDQVGNLIVTGGTFTAAQDQGSSTTLTRNHVLAFDAATGKLSTTFAPNVDGTVQAVAPGPKANTVYIGGLFSTVNGTKCKSIALLDTQTGALVPGWKPPALNGAVFTVASANGHLLIGGSFTLANSSSRQGLASLNPTTGALDDYLTVTTTGHHNYNGKGANGAVGPRSMAVNPAGTRLFVLGNFKNANGTLHDQAAMIDLTATSSALDPNWNTMRFTAPCASSAFDTYVSDVQWSPDGSYFVIAATGGGGISYNTDRTRSLCDSASRWETAVTGSNVQPTWVDYTGNDTFWSVALTGTAVYVGGHQRWVNNDGGSDTASAGAIPRPGLAALDPISGMPLSWNPGRNPRGYGAYALFVNAGGLYVGSDTDYIGNFEYLRRKIAYFPLSGGTAPASTTTAALPANVYLAGPLTPENGYTTNDVYYRNYDGTTVGATTGIGNTGVGWSGARGTFAVGSTLFYGASDGSFYRSTFDGQTIGAPTSIDPYNDPKWSTVSTGSKSTVYRGVKSSFYSQIPSVTGMFYSGGRLFYSLSGQTALFWRWFSPDSGAVGATQNTITGVDFSRVTGMFGSDSSVYYAKSTDGTLHRVSLNNATLTVGSDTTVSGPGIDGKDWRARGLFTFGSTANKAPTANATSSCTGLTCSFDASTSKDSDGTVTSYAWDFGDGTTGTGATAQHAYAAAGTYNVALTVTDNQGATSVAWTGQVTPSATSTTIGYVGVSGVSGTTGSPSVTVPPGTQAGNTELLVVTTNTSGVSTSAPTGFTQIAQQTNSPLETTIYTRTATASDAGSSLTVPLSSAVLSDVRLLVYSGVGSVTASVSGDSNATSHTTPAALATVNSSWLVSYWAVRTSTASTWTTPGSVTVRDTGVGSKSAHIDSVVGDSGPLSAGSYGALTAGSGAVGGKGGTASVVLAPNA